MIFFFFGGGGGNYLTINVRELQRKNSFRVIRFINYKSDKTDRTHIRFPGKCMGPRVTRNREKLRYFVYKLLGKFGAKVILL